MKDSTVPGFGAVRRNHSSIARRRSRVLVGCLLLASSMGFVSCLATVARSSPKPPPTPPRYAAFAQGVAEDYLAGRPTAVPTRPEMNSAVGRVVASDPTSSNTPRNSRPVALSYDYLVWESATRTALGKLPIEIHRFLVGANRQLFTLSVTIAETPTGPVVHALPSPGPALLADASGMKPIEYDRVFPKAVLSDGAQEQVRAWATAFAAGDERGLYLLTGDSGPRRYQGLGGYEVVGNPLVTSPYGVRAGVVAQVQVQMRLASNPSFVLNGSYDLLLGNLDRSLPTVSAWGPPGSGPTLVPFSNADPIDPSAIADASSVTSSSTTTTLPATTTTAVPTTLPAAGR